MTPFLRGQVFAGTLKLRNLSMVLICKHLPRHWMLFSGCSHVSLVYVGGEGRSSLSYSMIGGGFVCHCCCTAELVWLFVLNVVEL